ncbi:MAG: hypothetical protein ACM30G_20945, partial [Micromonosporaceae bacterium]
MSRRRLASDDSGASLVIALTFTTVVAVIVTAVLAFADVSLRTTMTLRGQAAQAAGADGAAQIAINTIRQGTYAGVGNCFGGSGTTLTLSNSYQPPTGPADSAVVTCALDEANSNGQIISSQNRPPKAIITLSSNVAKEDGLIADIRGPSARMRVDGDIASKTNIRVPHGTLYVPGQTVTAVNACDSGSITAATITCNPGPAPGDPGYAAPPPPTATPSVPNCAGNKNIMTFAEGLYTSGAALNAKTTGCKSIFYFPPGIYYFDFRDTKASDRVWTLDGGYLVAGTAALTNGTAPSMPGACTSPIPPSPIGSWVRAPGAQFVFGGESQLSITGTAQMEICAPYSSSSVPVAIYGLKNNIGSGSFLVNAQSGCVTRTLDINSACAAITTDKNSEQFNVYVQGNTYMPSAWLDLNFKKDLTAIFYLGVVARVFDVDGQGNANPPTPMVAVPGDIYG